MKLQSGPIVSFPIEFQDKSNSVIEVLLIKEENKLDATGLVVKLFQAKFRYSRELLLVIIVFKELADSSSRLLSEISSLFSNTLSMIALEIGTSP